MKAPTITPSWVAAFFSLANTWLLLALLGPDELEALTFPRPLLNTEPSSGLSDREYMCTVNKTGSYLTLMLVKLVELVVRDLRWSE